MVYLRQINHMSKLSAEDQLREIAAATKRSIREIYLLVDQVYRDEENYQKRIASANQARVAEKQLKLMDLQIDNEGMQAILLQGKLNRTIRAMRRWEKVKSLFTFKPKKNEPVAGNQ